MGDHVHRAVECRFECGDIRVQMRDDRAHRAPGGIMRRKRRISRFLQRTGKPAHRMAGATMAVQQQDTA
jgi:hypothetical protein